MPKIAVTERDLSWYFRQRGTSPATVYVPGVATFGPEDPVLCDSTNFANVFGTKPVQVKNEISYRMAESFIKAGFSVLFHRFIHTTATAATKTLNSGDASVQVSAKYAGSFGNSISVTFSGAGKSNVAVFVYINDDLNKTLVETLSVNFVDPTSDKYYKFVESDYIEFGKVTGVESATFIVKDSEIRLDSGTDFSDTSDDCQKTFMSDIATAISTAGALENLSDPYQYDFDVIVSGGWQEYQLTTTEPTEICKVDSALRDLAKKRGTAIYLVDGKSDWNDKVMYAYCGLFNDSYAAAFGPWSYAQFTSTGAVALLPGSYAMIIAWAQSCAAGSPVWMAPAGVKRATLGSFFKKTTYYVGKAVLDTWQNHDYVTPGQYSVNPIMKAKQYGYVVYGNSTLLKTRDDGATSMLQSFSVRVLANLIKSRAFDVSLYLQFDQLTSDLFNQFKSLMGTYMDQLRYQNALYDYEIVLTNNVLTNSDLNEKRLPVTIRISPNPAAENFEITLEVSQAGVSFSDDTDETEIG